MRPLPVISIVVPSFNQAQFLPETLQSLVDQRYPRLEVVIQEAGSRDGSIAIAEDFARRHPEIFRLFVERDSGQADALNRGFARVSGEVLGFLNSDDTLLPGVLHRVAAEIDPARGRYVVMGRCVFTGENSRHVGVEHPAEFISHFEHLAIWKRGFNTIPQPSVFWHRKVWERCGGLDASEQHALDYELFCRFSKHYRFHRVDEVWSTYRMHDGSKTAQRTEAEVLALAIKASRKHWGPWYSPLRWRCAISHHFYESGYHDRARHHARRAEEAFRARRPGAAALEFVQTARYSPRMARERLVYGWLAGRKVRLLTKLVSNDDGFTGRYPDHWIGPCFRQTLPSASGKVRVVAIMTFHPQESVKELTVELRANGASLATSKVSSNSPFSLDGETIASADETVAVEIRSSNSFVPMEVSGGSDARRLSLVLHEVRLDPAG